MSLAQGLERAVDRLTPVGVVGAALTVGFLLCLFSFFIKIGIGVNDPGAPGKEVGFLYAPNWTVVYMVLFPLYLALFSLIISSTKAFFNRSVSSAELRVITGPKGVPVDLDLVTTTWNIQLQRLSILLLILGFGVVVSSATQWYFSCFDTYSFITQDPQNIYKVGVRDWSTIPYTRTDGGYPGATIVFTAIAYAYMAFALFIYLAILAYCAYFATFMSRLADDTDKLRLVMRGGEPINFMSEIFKYTYALSFLGLCAAYFMRLQALYLSSDQKNVIDYQFCDFRWVFFRQCSSMSHLPSGESAFTSILEASYTLIMFALFVLMLARTYTQSKRYYLQKIGDPAWRRTMGIRYDADFVSALKKESFFKVVVPHYFHLAIPIVLMIAAIIFPFVGMLFVAAVLYAAIALLRGSPDRWDNPAPLTDPADSEHFRALVIAAADRSEIVLLLQHEASTVPQSDKVYENIVEMAEIPEEYKEDIVNRIRNQEDKAEALFDAAVDQGQNVPEFDKDKKNSTILGSILIVLKDRMGLDFQCLIVAKLEKCHLVANQIWLGQLSAQTCGLLPKSANP
jgi:hypothetical protein